MPAVGGGPVSTVPRKGDILLWWKASDDGGGVLTLTVDGRGTYSYGIPTDAFTYGWESWTASAQPAQGTAGEPIAGKPGQEVTLLSYMASQANEGGQRKDMPRITLRLKARFPTEAMPRV